MLRGVFIQNGIKRKGTFSMTKRIINYYKNLNIGIKVSLWFTFCNFFQKGISMLSVPIFTRIMSTEEYGIFSVYQSWYSILTIIVTLNLFAGVYNKGLVKFDNKRDEFTAAMLGLSACATAIFFLLYCIDISMWDKILELKPSYMIIMFAEMLCVPAYSYWSARQRFEYRYKNLVISTVVMSLLSPLLGIVAVVISENKAFARIFSYAFVQIIFGIVFGVYIIKKCSKLFNKEYWKYALAFNLPLIPHYLSQIILNQADRIMISRLVGSSEAAIYSVAYNISLIMSLLTNAINSAFVPSLYNCLKQKKYSRIKETSTYVLIIAAGVTFIAMLFGPELIQFFAPKSYYEAVWVIPPVALSVYFIAVYALFVNVEFYFEKTKYTMYVSVLGAVLNIFLNWIFIKQYGYIAAGYTTVVCYILFSIGHYILYRYLNKKYLNSISIIKGKIVMSVSILLVMLMLFTLVLYNYIWLRYALIGIIFVGAFIYRQKLIGIIKKIKE